jgi:hypothetical protein
MKANRIVDLQNDISAIAEKKLAEANGLVFRMPIGSHTLILIRDPRMPQMDIQFTETVYHGQTVWAWAASVTGNSVDEDDDDWSAIAAAQNGGRIPDDCFPAPQSLFRQRGSESIPLKSAIVTYMRDYMVRCDQAKTPQVIYAMVDFTGKTIALVAHKALKLGMGPGGPCNTTTEVPDAKKPCLEQMVIEEHLKSQLQRAAVITTSFTPDIKATLRLMATDAMNPSTAATVIEIMEYLENDPPPGKAAHPTLDMYDTDIICTAFEMAIAAPFDRSGGIDHV